MNRTYELMFIVRPDMVEEDQDKLISTLETAVSSSGGQVKSVERMGKRRLAYTVRKFHDGIFVLLTVEGSGGLIHELERRLRVTDSVELAWSDWLGSAQFDRLSTQDGEDVWAERWAQAYVEFAAGEKRSEGPASGGFMSPCLGL